MEGSLNGKLMGRAGFGEKNLDFSFGHAQCQCLLTPKKTPWNCDSVVRGKVGIGDVTLGIISTQVVVKRVNPDQIK